MSEWSLCGDHVNWFCVGIFHEYAGWVEYPNQKQWTWSPQSDHCELVLVFMPYYYRLDIDFNGLCVQL